MQVILYQPKYRASLKVLLIEFAEEVWQNDGLNVDVDLFVEEHWAVYLAIAKDGAIIGFSGYALNHYYGLRQATVANTYVFVSAEDRSSRVMYLFALQSGRISEDLQLPLEHYYASDASRKLSSKLEGVKLCDTYIYSVDEVARVFGKLKNKVRIEDVEK